MAASNRRPRRAATRMNALRHAALLATGMTLLPAFHSAPAAGTVSAFDAGGRRVSSASYVVDASLGSVGGIGAAAAPQVVARHGYAGQLYDVQSLALSASPAAVNEAGTSQLRATAVLDDSTLLPLAATNVAWSVAGGPLASISSGGLATASNVYQNAAATVRADYQAKSGTLLLTVLNVGIDDFGLNNPNAGPSADPDVDGVANLQEYVADTNPTNAASRFQIQSISNAAAFAVRFPSSAARVYTLYSTTNLTSGVWTNFPSRTDIPGSGGVDALSDPSSAGTQRFYRVGVRVP